MEASLLSLKGAHVALYVRDLARSRAFYQKVLGMAPSYELEGIVGYGLFPGLSLNLVKDLQKATPSSAPTLTLAVKDLQGLYQRLRAEGVLFLAPPEKGPFAWKAIFKDPDGNLIELAE